MFVDQAATGGVDHQRVGLEQGQFAGPEHVSGVLVQRAVQGQGVDLRQQLVQWQAVGAFRTTGDLPAEHAHAEGFGQPRHRTAQFAVAEQAKGLALQFDDGEVQQAELAGLGPLAVGYRLVVIAQAGGQGQQQGEGVLGHGRCAVALAVAHGDALGARGRQVDVVGAGGGHQDQLQLRVGCQGRGVEHDLVADYRHRALQAFGDLLRAGGGEQFELVELLLQG